MRSSRRGAIPSELGGLIDDLNNIEKRLRRLESPAGVDRNLTVEKLSDTIAQLKTLVENMNATLQAFIQDEIDGIVDDRVAVALAALLAGDVTIGGKLNVAGTVTLPGARATDVSTATDRAAAWLAGDGSLGHT